ncbi:MAG: RluA family pseudouridine synthase [Myxococcales bacterium]|nr:RluA family pseudouridine synthase [Myxococcales bacterium]
MVTPFVTRIVTLVVPVELAGARADKVVTELLGRAGARTGRAEVQRWITADRVKIAGNPVTNRTPLACGSELVVLMGEPRTSDATADASVIVNVVYEDEYLLVVDKPAGLVVHPARGHWGGTLVNGLLAHGGFEAAGRDERDTNAHLRPGIVHRLDKDTSGLLIVAKRADVRDALKERFSRHDIERAYVGIVLGEAQPAVIDTPHGRHRNNRLKFTSLLPDGPGVRRAITTVTPLETIGGHATVVRCVLTTGRTHQIRVHLAERSKTPIFADALYGKVPSTPELRAIAEALGRQALHAAVLGVTHPITGALMRWESPLPADMAAALLALRALTRSAS